jgi:sortase A
VEPTRRERARHQLLRRRKRLGRAGFVAVAILIMLVPSLRAPAPTAGSATAHSTTGDDPIYGGLTAPVASVPSTEFMTVLGRLQIPAIGLDETMYEGVSASALQRGPGHWPGTPLPGRKGNAVLAGYRLTGRAPFANLYSLHSGDDIHVTAGADRIVYRVFETLAVDAAEYPEVVLAEPTGQARVLTLFACHPQGSDSRRFVVRARALEDLAP